MKSLILILTILSSSVAMAENFIGNLSHKACPIVYKETGGVILEHTVNLGSLLIENCAGCGPAVINPYFTKGVEKLRAFGLKDQESASIYDFDNNCVFLLRTLGSKVEILGSYGASGGRGGVSNVMKSGGTTGGVHRTFLGAEEEKRISTSPMNYNLDPGKSGYVTGVVVPTTGYQDWVTDFVLSRFIRLKGLEAQNSTASARKILFHGTHEEGLLDYHESAGCIRMANTDVIEFYDRLPLGSLVNVVSSSRPNPRNRISKSKNKVIVYDESSHPGLVKAGRR